MSRIPIEKTVFDKDAFNKVVSTQFNQLQPANGLNQAGSSTPSFTLEDFLALFNSLYDLIPPDVLRQLLEKMAKTLGVKIDNTDIQALLEEITSLRQQLVEIQTTVNSVNKLANQA
jgi:predicted component of type VI protein secretion system